MIAAVLVALGSGMFPFWFGRFWDDGNAYQGPARGSVWSESTRGFYHDRSGDRIVDLGGEWRFRPGDDPEWADPSLDVRDWDSIGVGQAWERAGYDGYDGVAWYRRTFSLDAADADGPLYLRLGPIDDADETFVNGVRIGAMGAFPPDDATAWNVLRIYRIPGGLLRPGGNNVIAVRVYDGRQGGGIVGDVAGIYASNLPEPLIDLAGEWELAPESSDAVNQPPADDDTFRPVIVPGYWDRQGLQDYDGFAWYRTRFALEPPSGDDRLVLLLGKIDDRDEAYLNGTKIGETVGEDTWDQRRKYSFDASLLRSGENELLVRVEDLRMGGGITHGPVGIMTVEAAKEYWRLRDRNEHAIWGPVWDWLLGKE